MRMGKLGCAVVLLAVTAAIGAQEKGYWTAASKTAKSVTGDLQFSADKITIDFSRYPLAQIRELTAEEKAVLFPEAGEGAGNLYRVEIPAERRFLHKNTLCGSEETDWVVTWVSGRKMDVALFSQVGVPKVTAEEILNGHRLCGTYSYTR
ncbi:MAG: hypothetical protein V4555_14420 [Acidobacteriota bacterium]